MLGGLRRSGSNGGRAKIAGRSQNALTACRRTGADYLPAPMDADPTRHDPYASLRIPNFRPFILSLPDLRLRDRYCRVCRRRHAHAGRAACDRARRPLSKGPGGFPGVDPRESGKRHPVRPRAARRARCAGARSVLGALRRCHGPLARVRGPDSPRGTAGPRCVASRAGGRRRGDVARAGPPPAPPAGRPDPPGQRGSFRGGHDRVRPVTQLPALDHRPRGEAWSTP
jgi:hypothetical protein